MRKICSKKWYLKRDISCDAHLLNELLETDVPWDDAIVVSAGKLSKLWDSLSELRNFVGERRLERTILRSALLPVKTAQFTQFFRLGMTSHSKIAQFNWECTAPIILLVLRFSQRSLFLASRRQNFDIPVTIYPSRRRNISEDLNSFYLIVCAVDVVFFNKILYLSWLSCSWSGPGAKAPVALQPLGLLYILFSRSPPCRRQMSPRPTRRERSKQREVEL
jgi:hypothetical protein